MLCSAHNPATTIIRRARSWPSSTRWPGRAAGPARPGVHRFLRRCRACRRIRSSSATAVVVLARSPRSEELAGLRVGYAVANARRSIASIASGPPATSNRLGQVVGLAALEGPRACAEDRAARARRAGLPQRRADEARLRVSPSQATSWRSRSRMLRGFAAHLMRAGILVRDGASVGFPWTPAFFRRPSRDEREATVPAVARFDGARAMYRWRGCAGR